MTITFTNLSGARENLDLTIKDLLSDNWTAGNITGTITPTFTCDTEEPDYLARKDNSDLNAIRVQLFSRERYNKDDTDVNGDDKHTWVCKLLIQVQAESLVVMTQMEDEVNRILWESRPNNNTRLPKSNGSNSEVAYFEDSEIEFNRVEPEDENDDTPSSEAQLFCIYYKTRT